MSQTYSSSAVPTEFSSQRDLPSDVPNPINSKPGSSHGGRGGDNSQLPVTDCMLAGGLGGVIGDTTMHSLDTVKARQQGLLFNPKYHNMVRAYATISREEGFFRGLYGGYTPAIIGSFPSTAAFFGAYELSKRVMINDLNMNETVSFLFAGTVGDLALSVFYVPSEVLKTRLQLQGHYNNPYTKGCGYNYKGLRDAIRLIAASEGIGAFFYGYKETLFRDVPFSALQLAFYEKFRRLAIIYNAHSDDLTLCTELLTGAAAGGLAGVLTTPLDVIKTRIQTATLDTAGVSISMPSNKFLLRFPTASALCSIYRSEGILGMFSGVGPRFIWTGVQSSIMLLLYQVSLKKLDSIMGKAF